MKLRKILDEIIKLYIDIFCKKHKLEFYGFVNDNNSLHLSEYKDTTDKSYLFYTCDIIYDIDNDCKERQILKWHEHNLKKDDQEISFIKYLSIKNKLNSEATK